VLIATPHLHLINFAVPLLTMKCSILFSESLPAKFLNQFEDKFEFKIYSQWTDNFVSDHVSEEKQRLNLYS
jgi:hypothetical protein